MIIAVLEPISLGAAVLAWFLAAGAAAIISIAIMAIEAIFELAEKWWANLNSNTEQIVTIDPAALNDAALMKKINSADTKRYKRVVARHNRVTNRITDAKIVSSDKQDSQFVGEPIVILDV